MIRTLEALARQVRQSTIQLLEMASDDALTWAPAGTSNHVLWHAGHALWLQDVLTVGPLTGSSEAPAGWADAFGQHCRPPRQTMDWPRRERVRELLDAQLERVVRLIHEHEPRLREARGHAPRGGGWPLVDGIVHAWHDEARHQGEMYLLLKLHSWERRR